MEGGRGVEIGGNGGDSVFSGYGGTASARFSLNAELGSPALRMLDVLRSLTSSVEHAEHAKLAEAGSSAAATHGAEADGGDLATVGKGEELRGSLGHLDCLFCELESVYCVRGPQGLTRGERIENLWVEAVFIAFPPDLLRSHSGRGDVAMGTRGENRLTLGAFSA